MKVTIASAVQDATKDKIREVVKMYLSLYSTEYSQFHAALREKRTKLKDKFGSTKGLETIERELFEIPETLYTILLARLTPEEIKFWRSRPGSIWFAKAYHKEFGVPEKI